jgi:hypothetical protein
LIVEIKRKQRHILERRHRRKLQQLCHSILQTFGSMTTSMATAPVFRTPASSD